MLVEGLRSTGEGFVIRRELWNIGGKIEKSAEKADLRERGNIRARECFGRGNLRGKLENLGELGRGKLKGLMEVHGRIVRGTRTGFEGSVGEFSHVGDILTCFNSTFLLA